jgi:uncharacterized membrane protein
MAKKSESPKASSGGIGDGKLCALLSYLLVGIIWFFADDKMRKNGFVKFHVKQGIVLTVAAIVVSIIERILISIFWGSFFFGGWGLLGTIFWIVWLGFLVLLILGIVNSLNGKEKQLPIIGGFASKLTF